MHHSKFTHVMKSSPCLLKYYVIKYPNAMSRGLPPFCTKEGRTRATTTTPAVSAAGPTTSLCLPPSTVPVTCFINLLLVTALCLTSFVHQNGVSSQTRGVNNRNQGVKRGIHLRHYGCGGENATVNSGSLS